MAIQVALRLESKLRAGKPLAFARCRRCTAHTHATPPHSPLPRLHLDPRTRSPPQPSPAASSPSGA